MRYSPRAPPGASSSQEALSDESSSSTAPEAPRFSSADFGQVVPLYGVQLRDWSSSSNRDASSGSQTQACVEDVSGRKNDDEYRNGVQMVYNCEVGVTCQETITMGNVCEYDCFECICPDYGVVYVSEKTYTCDGGNTYNETEFRSRYFVENEPSN